MERGPHPDFEGMWKRGFIELLQPGGYRALRYCYAAVGHLPANPVTAPIVRNDT
jgi:hypothetical protein